MSLFKSNLEKIAHEATRQALGKIREGESFESAVQFVREAMHACFEQAAAHLDEHAQGYEHTSKSMPEQGSQEWRRRDEVVAQNLREKATQIRLMKKEV